MSTDLRYHLTTFHYCRVHYNRSFEVSLKSYSNRIDMILFVSVPTIWWLNILMKAKIYFIDTRAIVDTYSELWKNFTYEMSSQKTFRIIVQKMRSRYLVIAKKSENKSEMLLRDKVLENRTSSATQTSLQTVRLHLSYK